MFNGSFALSLVGGSNQYIVCVSVVTTLLYRHTVMIIFLLGREIFLLDMMQCNADHLDNDGQWEVPVSLLHIRKKRDR